MNELKIKPYLLTNKIQHYAWGTKDNKAFIPKLLNIRPEPGKPYAELWMGVHPKAPSKLENGYTLTEFIKSYPDEVLGPSVARKFNNELPFFP